MTVELIREAAAEIGFDAVAISSVAALVEDGARFRAWLEQGYHAGMAYMARNPELQAQPADLVAEARSIITIAINYYTETSETLPQNQGRVAQYAHGEDYHLIIKEKLSAFVSQLETKLDRKIKARIFTDAVPLLERAVARRSGLGFQGKNTNLIRRRAGSYFFIAEIISDLELAETPPDRVSCGSCTRCIEACPTNAITKPYEIDSNLCIAYLTIENRGGIPVELRPQIGEWIFGCDICQQVCPFNRFAQPTTLREFLPEAGAGEALDLVEILSLDTDESFRARFKRSPVLRAKRRGLVRNAIVVAGNKRALEAAPALRRLASDESDGMLQEHAAWALAQLDLKQPAEMG